MKTERQQLLMLVVSTIAIAAIGWGLYVMVTPRATKPGDAFGKYKLIKMDMTEADVVKIMAVPAGDHSTGALEFPFCGTGLPRETFREHAIEVRLIYKHWLWDDGRVELAFGADGIVSHKSFMPAWPPEPLLRRVSHWFGR